MNAKKTLNAKPTLDPQSTSASAPPLADLMPPISATQPCGPNLEYDPEYVTLMSQAAPRGEAQYGDFIGTPAAHDWSQIERDCQRLLLRSRDINLLVLLLRCRIRLAQAHGLQAALAQLLMALQRYPEAIHPQATIEGETDLTVRANALAVLSDPEGILGDVREIVLSGHNTMRLQVRDVERACAVPRPADALSLASVQLQIAHLQSQNGNSIAAMIDAAQLCARLQAWAGEHLGALAPDLSKLTDLLGLFLLPTLSAPAAAPAVAVPANPPEAKFVAASETTAASASTTMTTPATVVASTPSEPPARTAAVAAMVSARQWFEQHEPSSPVALLLRQAEMLVGKRFAQVVQCLPVELLERWEQEQNGANCS